MAIAAEQFPVVERGNLAEALHRHRLAPNGDDRIRGDRGTPARRPRNTAMKSERGFPQRPCHQVLGVIETGLLPGHPAVRYTVKIERQYQWYVTHHAANRTGWGGAPGCPL